MRLNYMKQLLLLVFLILFGFVTSCGRKPPKDLIPKDKFINIMVDLELNQVYYQATRDSVSADSIQNKILNHYNITGKQYAATRDYYQKTGQEHEIIKKALDHLNNEKDKLYGYISQKTDTTHKKQKIEKRDTTSRSRKHPDHLENH